jgi:hypothetical protein
VLSDDLQNKIIAEYRHPKSENRHWDPWLGTLVDVSDSTSTAQVLKKRCQTRTASTDGGAKCQE